MRASCWRFVATELPRIDSASTLSVQLHVWGANAWLASAGVRVLPPLRLLRHYSPAQKCAWLETVGFWQYALPPRWQPLGAADSAARPLATREGSIGLDFDERNVDADGAARGALPLALLAHLSTGGFTAAWCSGHAHNFTVPPSIR